MHGLRPRRRPDPRRSATTAFTLVELLVVISIVTLLIALLLPALGTAREMARRTQCASNVRAQTLALLGYAQDYRGWLPTYDVPWAKSVGDFYFSDSDVPGLPVWQWGLNHPRFHQIIRIWGAGKYVPSPNVNVCPSLAARVPLAATMWTWTAATHGTPQLNYSGMARGEGHWRDYHLGGPSRPISYIGNSLGPLDVPKGQRRTGAFNIGDGLGYGLGNTPFYDFLVRDGANNYAWDTTPFNHARGGGATWADTANGVTGWNVGYPDGHAAWVNR